MARRSAKLLRDKTPNLREEPQVYYVVDKHMCFVCYRLADMPTPRVAAGLRLCAGCGAPIWVSKKSSTVPPKICTRCMDLDSLPERQKSA